MAEVNGILIDLRHMLREVQHMAFDKGMIPYIPADQEKVPEKKGPEQSNCDVGGEPWSNLLKHALR